MRTVIPVATIFLITLGTVAHTQATPELSREKDRNSTSSVSATLALREQKNAGVVAEITIVNRSPTLQCVPRRQLGLAPWPFSVTDDTGHAVPPLGGGEDDAFSGFSETFYVIGAKKTLIRKLFLLGRINIPAGTAYTFRWAGDAYSCADVGGVLGREEELRKLRATSLTATARLAP